MPIPNDEKKLYNDFALQLAHDLGSISDPKRNTMLWHYTTGSALTAILESMTIFATHLSCLNDAAELRYGSTLFSESLSKLRSTVAGTEAALLDAAISYFRENPEFPAQAVVPNFVACFSEERDSLSQWRAYGGGENGYANRLQGTRSLGMPELNSGASKLRRANA